MAMGPVQSRRDLYFQQPADNDRRLSTQSAALSKTASSTTASSLFEQRELLAFDQFLDELAVDNAYLFNPRIPAPLTEILSTRAPQEYESVKREGLQFGTDPDFDSAGYQTRNRHIVPRPWLNSLAGELSGQEGKPLQQQQQQQYPTPQSHHHHHHVANGAPLTPQEHAYPAPATGPPGHGAVLHPMQHSDWPRNAPPHAAGERFSSSHGGEPYKDSAPDRAYLPPPPPQHLPSRYEDPRVKPEYPPVTEAYGQPLLPLIPAKRGASNDTAYGYGGRPAPPPDRRASDFAGTPMHHRSPSVSAPSPAAAAGKSAAHRKRASPHLGGDTRSQSAAHDHDSGLIKIRPKHGSLSGHSHAGSISSPAPHHHGGSHALGSGESAANDGAVDPRKPLTNDQKRQNHISSEQKRRDQIKEGFADLAARVPRLKGGSESKSGMLNEAIDYVRLLKSRNETKRRRLVELRLAAGLA